MPKNRKNTFILLAILLLIIVLLWHLKLRNNDSSAAYNFAISDTASISKIFIADMKGKSITLDREDGNWRVNNRFKARENTVNILLKTIKNISVQRPVSESRYNMVIKDLATNGVKIEIYLNNNESPTKTYFIGNNTDDHTGTYMILKNQEQPYIMHIIGFNGIMNPRYGLQGQEVNITIWRDRTIFDLNAKEITSINLINEKDLKSSFSIKNTNGNQMLFNYQSKEEKIKKEAIITYLNKYQEINCETFKKEHLKQQLKNSDKLYSLFVAHQNKVDSLIIYSMKKEGDAKTKEKNSTVERMYAILNDGDVMLIQNYVFNKLLITIDELKEK
ncbi:MAG: DUF4340 domain-containing protein [Flavobacteriales bacterium]|nr:DUF4340 domain-containing protein [Flavobacteriales bacterium]